jgi:ribosomal protein S18 acetylase RimI-like enzyme
MPATPALPDLLVRDARADEVEAVGRLTLQAYEDADILGVDPRYREQLLDAAARADGSHLLVAVSGAALLGTVTFCPHGSSHAEIARADEAEFRMLAVDASASGQGVGRALVADCEQRARALGCTRMVLSVIDHNTKAAALYERLGYRRAPERDWEPVPGVLLRVWDKGLLEPPRRCSACGRRMVVQVMPAGWTATCSEHGAISG